METSEEFRTASDEAAEDVESSTDDPAPASDAEFDAPTGTDVSEAAEAGVDRLSEPETVETAGEPPADETGPATDDTDPDDPDALPELDEDAFVAPSGDVDEAEPAVADEAPLDREADLPVDDDSIAEDLAGEPDADTGMVDEAAVAFDGLEGGSLEEAATDDEASDEDEGVATVEVVEIDEDGDGVPDVTVMAIDEDGDGVPDVVAIDEDGDGVPDVVAVMVDEDGDGEPDAVIVAVDEDGDGEPDVIGVAIAEEESEAGDEAQPEEEAEAEEAADEAEPEAPAEELVAAAEAEEAEEAEPEAAASAAASDGEAAPAEDGAATKARDPFGGPGDWYVVHTYAGYENKVKANLLSRIHSMQMEDKIFNVHIPMEDVLEIKGGKRQVVQRKVFPGYLLVKMFYDNDSWYVVRNTPGVTGFVSSGTGTKPTPLSKREVEKILAVKQETEAKPAFRLEFEEGDTVRIVSGPFADFNGTVSEINVDQSKLKVLVSIFDRETPVELGFDQVAKV